MLFGLLRAISIIEEISNNLTPSLLSKRQTSRRKVNAHGLRICPSSTVASFLQVSFSLFKYSHKVVKSIPFLGNFSNSFKQKFPIIWLLVQSISIVLLSNILNFVF